MVYQLQGIADASLEIVGYLEIEFLVFRYPPRILMHVVPQMQLRAFKTAWLAKNETKCI